MKKLDKEQLEAINKAFDNSLGSERFNETLEHEGLIKEEFIDGDLYKYIDGSLAVYQGGSKGFGFNEIENYYNVDGWSFECDPQNWTPATEEDKKKFNELLKAEGNKYIGKNVKCLYDGETFEVRAFDDYMPEHNKLWYHTTERNGVLLMKNGDWATILEEKEEPKKEIILNGVTYIEK